MRLSRDAGSFKFLSEKTKLNLTVPVLNLLNFRD